MPAEQALVIEIQNNALTGERRAFAHFADIGLPGFSRESTHAARAILRPKTKVEPLHIAGHVKDNKVIGQIHMAVVIHPLGLHLGQDRAFGHAR